MTKNLLVIVDGKSVVHGYGLSVIRETYNRELGVLLGSFVIIEVKCLFL